MHGVRKASLESVHLTLCLGDKNGFEELPGINLVFRIGLVLGALLLFHTQYPLVKLQPAAPRVARPAGKQPRIAGTRHMYM